MVPKVWVATQTRVAKGQNMGRGEAIHIPGLYVSPLTLLVFVCLQCRYLRKEEIADTTNELCNFLLKIIHAIITLFICCLRLGSRGVQQVEIWVALKNVW